MTAVPRARLLLPLVLACAAGPAHAQGAPAAGEARPRVEVAARPDTVTVGDRYLVVLRVHAPAGARVEPPARLDSTPELHPVGARVDRADAAGRVAFGYPMVSWRPGEPAPVFAPVRVTYADGRVSTLRVPLRLPFVRSVLPADTAGVEPRGPKDVLGPDRDSTLLAVLAVLALLLLAPASVFFRRMLRRWAARRAARPAADPRERALAALERARRARPAETGEWKAFYALTSEAVRGYLDALSPRWGADLTTDELLRALEASRVAPADVRAVGALLEEADAVKFARAGSTPDAAARHWRRARDWVASFDAGEPDGSPGASEPAEVAR